MIAIDTNVLVRLLAADEPTQTRRARKLIESNDVLVATTVLLETEWVLRSAYKIERRLIANGLRRLLGLRTVTPESPSVVSRALDSYDAGLDFADALHLASTPKVDVFHTFDLKLARAGRESIPPVAVVPA